MGESKHRSIGIVWVDFEPEMRIHVIADGNEVASITRAEALAFADDLLEVATGRGTGPVPGILRQAREAVIRRDNDEVLRAAEIRENL